MKILKKDNPVKISVENADDLWYLSTIIDENDTISSSTTRKIKLGGADDRSQKVIKKQVFLTIIVEKVEFHKYTNHLRINGKVTEGPEDVPRGSYHTFDVADGTVLSIFKEVWPKFQKDKLAEAAAQKRSSIMVVVMDREQALFALLKRYGYELVSKLQGDVQKKHDGEGNSGSFYASINTALKEYAERYGLERIILASPAFFKDDLYKSLDAALQKKILLATCASGDERAIVEVLKRPETRSALSDDRTSAELQLVERLLGAIAKTGLATYGFDQVVAAVKNGQVDELLVTDGLIAKLRDEDKFAKLDRVMKLADSMQAKIHIVNSDNDGGRKLDGLGGIGTLLRYKVDY